MKVYYGIGKVNKIQKKREIKILYENQNGFRYKNGESYQDRYIKRAMHLAYTRFQTKEEEKDAIGAITTFTGYSIFIDSKPFNGSLKKALEHNKAAEIKNLSKSELDKIYKALESEFKYVFEDYKEPITELTLFDEIFND